MRQHEHVDVKKHDQHQYNSCCGKAAGGWKEKSDAADYLCHSAYAHQSLRVRIVIRHDVHIKWRMPEVVDTAQKIERCLRYKRYAV